MYAMRQLDQGYLHPSAKQGAVLVIVPCGKSKIWDRLPDRGPVSAGEAYTGTPVRPNRHYAERFGDAWGVLSAKYGFIAPAFIIPVPY